MVLVCDLPPAQCGRCEKKWRQAQKNEGDGEAAPQHQHWSCLPSSYNHEVPSPAFTVCACKVCVHVYGVSVVVHCGDKPARRCRRDGVERLPGGLFAGIVCCARVAPLGDRERQVWCEPGGPNLGVQIRTSVVSFERVHGGLHAPKKTNYMELSEGALVRKALPAVASKSVQSGAGTGWLCKGTACLPTTQTQSSAWKSHCRLHSHSRSVSPQEDQGR